MVRTHAALLFLVACGGGEPSQGAQPTNVETEEPSPAQEAPTAESTAPSATTAEAEEEESITYAPVAGRIRFVVVAENTDGLLGSEERAVGQMKDGLERIEGVSVTQEPASDGERAFADALRDGESPTRPDEWAEAETVVLLQVATPEVRGERRISLGMRMLAVLHGEGAEPMYVERARHRPSTWGSSSVSLAQGEGSAVPALVRALLQAEGEG